MSSLESARPEELEALFKSGEIFTSGLVKINDLSEKFFVCAAAGHANPALDNAFRVSTGAMAMKAQSAQIDFIRANESTFAFARFDDEIVAEQFSEQLKQNSEIWVTQPFRLPEHTL